MPNSIIKATVGACLLLANAVAFGAQDWARAKRAFVPAAAAETCPKHTQTVGRLRITQEWVGRDKKCILMVSTKAGRGKSRAYLFNNYGMLLTFNVFGKGSISRTTGARTHFVLPNVQPLRKEIRGGRLYVHMSSGDVVTFNAWTGRPEGISKGVFRVSRNVTALGGGGVQLRSQVSVVIDHGFMRGESPHLEPNRVATITDANGRRCRVRNSDLFSYERGEPQLRFTSAGQLSAFLKSGRGATAKCSSLTVPRA